MKTEVEQVLDLARSQIGVKESPMGTNRVKYNTEYYGTEVSGSAYPWCCAFQWWLFQHAGVGDLFFSGEKTASCTTLYNFYKKRGQAVSKADIKPGDLVFFVFDGGKSGGMNHIGICESVEPGFVTTIDGNTGNDEANGGTVARKRRALKYVGGAARPAYQTVQEEDDDVDINRFKELYAEMRREWQDNDSSEWSQEARDWAVQTGLIAGGSNGEFNGMWEDTLTREQAACLFYRFAKMMGMA